MGHEAKAWVLLDSRTGYTWNWDLYTGRDDSARSDSLTMHVVLKLVCDLPLSEYHVYFDNLYTSPGEKVRAQYKKSVIFFSYRFV